MKSGAAIAIWADAYAEQDGAYVFEVLIDAEDDLPDYTLVLGRTPGNPRRVRIAVASLAIADVEGLDGG